MGKRTIWVKSSCFAPEFEMIIPIPTDRDDELIERLRYDDIQAIDEEEFAAAVRKLIFDADPGVQLPF